MAEQPIRFDDGAACERMMGVWSRLAGEIFLDWLAPRNGLKWVDVGCGNGAFTELIVVRNAPAEVSSVDPSEGQLAYARTRRGTEMAQFRQGDAMALPFPDRAFDVAIMGTGDLLRSGASQGCRARAEASERRQHRARQLRRVGQRHQGSLTGALRRAFWRSFWNVLCKKLIDPLAFGGSVNVRLKSGSKS